MSAKTTDVCPHSGLPASEFLCCGDAECHLDAVVLFVTDTDDFLGWAACSDEAHIAAAEIEHEREVTS